MPFAGHHSAPPLCSCCFASLLLVKSTLRHECSHAASKSGLRLSVATTVPLTSRRDCVEHSRALTSQPLPRREMRLCFPLGDRQACKRVAGWIPEPSPSPRFPSLVCPPERVSACMHTVSKCVSVTFLLLLSLKRQAQMPRAKPFLGFFEHQDK